MKARTVQCGHSGPDANGVLGPESILFGNHAMAFSALEKCSAVSRLRY